MSRFESWNLDVNQITLNDAEMYLDEFDIVINTTRQVWQKIMIVLSN